MRSTRSLALSPRRPVAAPPQAFLALAALVLALLLGAAAPAGAQALAPVPPPVAAPPAGDSHVALDARLHHRVLDASGDRTNHLLVRLTAEPVQAERRLPLNMVLVIDRSGSMAGEKIRRVREAAKFVVDQLQDGDFVSVVSFSSGVRVLQPAAPVASVDRRRLKRRIDGLRDAGGTNMLAALAEGMAQARQYAIQGRVNRVLLLSDGRPDSQAGLRQWAAGGLDVGVFLTTMGVGRDYDEDLMAGLADAGHGNYYFIERASDVVGIFRRELQDLMAVVAREGVLTVSVPAGVMVEQVHGWASTPRKDGVMVALGDLYGGRSAEVLLRLSTSGEPPAEAPVAHVRVVWHDVAADREATAEASVFQMLASDKAQVKIGTDPLVGAKVVRVIAAEAKAQAMRLYGEGRAQEARGVLGRAAAGARTTASAGFAPGDAADETAADLDDLSREVEATPAAAPAAEFVRKRAKAAARDDMR